MKRALILLSALIMAGAMSLPALAQTGPGAYNGNITQGEVGKFNNFLNAHPTVAHQLAANPGLIDNSNFIANHPHLHAYLQSHPGIRQEIHETPGRFIYREGRYEWYNPHYPLGYGEHGAQAYAHPGYAAAGPHPLYNTDRYLDQHPEVAGQLQAHPGLVDDPHYLATHPGLHGFLESHPDARYDWRHHPRAYMSHEQAWDQHHDR